MRDSRNGAEYLVEFFRRAGVKYAFGIPGHGNVCLFDAVKETPGITMIPVKHEQWGGHMADGYFRANRKVPAMVTTSVGPGATNLATACATAFVDSSSFIAVTGQVQTYLFGMGIFQEVERKHWVDYSNGMAHFVKQAWTITSGKQLPRVLPNSLRTAVGGRPGPVLIEVPMDVQVEELKAEVPNPAKFLPSGRISPDQEGIREAAKLLLGAERPLILIGGGIVMSGATPELIRVADFLGAPVVTSFRGDAKGGFPGDHELDAFHPGNVGNVVSNTLAKEADVLLAIGVTFSDETTSSYADGITFNIPPTKVVQIDLDVHEIAKNYPVELGIVADAKAALASLATVLPRLAKREDYHKSPWFKRLVELRKEWNADLESLWRGAPMGIPHLVKIMREKLPKRAIVAVSAGLPQEIMSQQWTSYHPRTFLSSGGFSTMGFALPAAMGAKLAARDEIAVAVEGDGSFLMNNMELATSIEMKIPVVVIVLNNYGFVSIRDLQIRSFKKRTMGTEFRRRDGTIGSPDFEKIVTAYGAEYARAEKPEEFASGLGKAIRSEVPFVLEAIVERKFPLSGTKTYGYWDIPSPYS